MGYYTSLILQNSHNYNIIGLADRFANGQTIYGIKVLSDKEIAQNADLIIIVANLSTSQYIYERIRNTVQNNHIEVYYLNGKQPYSYNNEIEKLIYWENNTRKNLECKIKDADIISFDIFDTLVMRKCLYLDAVFDLLENEMRMSKSLSRSLHNIIKKVNIRDIRKNAEKNVFMR